MHQNGTYKDFSDRSSIRKSGNGPSKLLFDKSLTENNLNAELQFSIPNKVKINFQIEWVWFHHLTKRDLS